jgi:hypothetical protein
LGFAHQRHRQVEPAPHSPRVRRAQLVSRLDEVELLKEIVGPTTSPGAIEMVQVSRE